MSEAQSLKGRTVLLTGATGGIGVALGRRLADCGTRLLLVGRNRPRLLELQCELGDAVVTTIAGDLTNQADLDGIIRDAHAAGDIDILINNAGVFSSASIFETSDADFESSLTVNLVAPFKLAKAFARGMVRRGWGRIINIGSSSSYSGFANGTAYCSAKHGLLGLSRTLHAELGPDGVRVCCVSPGSVKTEMGRSVPNQDFDTFIDPQDVADAVVFVLGQDGNAAIDEIQIKRVSPR